VRTSSDDTYSYLIVGNTGYEVDAADVPGLFEPFRRGSWDRTGGRGSGLGLSIVRAVADAHGGTVSATANATDGGLEVTVKLPAAATTPVVTASASVPRS
jgi:signal transduction histidine kinase